MAQNDDLFAGMTIGDRVVPDAPAQAVKKAGIPETDADLFEGMIVGDSQIPTSRPSPQPVPTTGTQPIQRISEAEKLKLLETLRPPAKTGFEAFGAGVVRGAERAGAGITQRATQALKALGIEDVLGVDTSDFLKKVEQSEKIQAAQFEPTAEESPITSGIGEVVGGAAALPLPATTLKAAAATGAVIGGLEFGEKGTALEFAKNVLFGGVFGLSGQIAADKLVSLTKSAANKLGLSSIPDNLFKPDGGLKPEAEGFLAKEGIELDDLSNRVISEVQAQPEGADVAQALRAAQAKELGITELTRGDVTQQFADQSTEFNLSRQRGTPEAEALRQQKAAQNQQIISAGEEIVRGTGGDSSKLQAGQVIQDALRGAKNERREAINQLYNIAEQEAGVAIPVGQEGVAKMFADQDFIFGLDPDIGGQLKAVQKQLEAFSVMPPELIQSASDLKRIRPLTIGSAEQLRKNIRSLISDTDPKSQRALTPIIESIDDAIDEIAITNEFGDAAQQAFKKARQARAQFGRDFEAKDIVQNIVSFKPGTQTDLVPASVAFDKIMNTQARLENTQAIKDALLIAGPEGDQAWKNFKATAAAELMSNALTTGKTASGDLRFSGANFNKALKNIGDDTLKTIFNPPELAKIKQLGRVTRDITILQDGVFTPSGAQIENSLQKISKLPLFKLSPVTNVVVNEGAEQLKKGQRRRELSKVLDPKIDIALADELGTMSNNAVNVLRLLALSGQSKLVEENE